MKRQSIIIIIIITFLVGIVTVSLLQKEPGLSSIYLNTEKILTESELKQKIDSDTFPAGGDLYFIVFTENVSGNDSIIIQVKDTGGNIIQKDTVIPESNGSGNIIVSMIKKNDKLISGVYTVEAYLNDSLELEQDFSIIENP